jgi:AraC-like DNA-binding protein/mannose-6-phosphate isomerase-like protein (cupin superfamily)
VQIQLTSSQFMEESSFPFWIRRYYHDHENTPLVHGHDFIELVYIVRGEAQHCFEGDEYDVRAGDVFIINPGEVHTYRIDPGKQIEIINCIFLPNLIQDTLLRELGISQSMDYFYVHPFLDKNERFYHRLNLHGEDSERALSLLEGMIKELQGRDPGYSTIIRLKMVELLILLSRYYRQRMSEYNNKKAARGSEHQLLIRRIYGYLERHYDKKISIPSLCELFNISSRQMNRIFKKETGMTVLEKIHEIRIEKAKQLLLETDEKVINIAGRVGYEDPAFFSQLFRRQVGCSPGKFRLE